MRYEEVGNGMSPEQNQLATLRKKYRIVSFVLVAVIIISVVVFLHLVVFRPASKESSKDNRLMEFHAAAGIPMFNIPELQDMLIHSYSFRSSLTGAPENAWDVSQNQDGSVLAWVVYDGEGKNMIIAADGMIKAPRDCHGMFHNQSGTASIRFNGCLDTSQVTNMSDMFGLCRSLTELDLTGFDTSKVTDMSGMFMFCESVKVLDLSSFNTSMVTDMSDMFYGCYELKSIMIDTLDMSHVIDRDSMFSGCNKLDTSTLPFPETRGNDNVLKANEALGHPWIFDIANPDEIVSICFLPRLDNIPADAIDVSQRGDLSVMAWSEVCPGGKKIVIAADGVVKAPDDCSYLFAYCQDLASIQFNDCLDTSQVTDMSCMFYCCESLTELDVSSFNTGNVKTMSSMFSNCAALKRLDLSNFDTGKVINMAGLFSGCRRLTYVDLSGFDTSHVTDMDCMFLCCEALTTVDIEVLDMSSVERADSMFSGCNKLDVNSICIKTNSGKSNKLRYSVGGNFLYDIIFPCNFTTITFRTSLTGAPADSWDFSEYQDGSVLGWVSPNSSGNELIIAADGKIIAPNSCAWMFDDYEFLCEINFNDSLDTSETVDMKGMFFGCSALTHLDLSGFDTSAVSDMSSMFSWCEQLEDVDVSSFDTSNVLDMTCMFEYCYTMEQLDITSFDMSSVRKTEGMFLGCYALKELAVTVLDMSHVTSSEGMFSACPLLDTSRIFFYPAGWTWDELK